MPGGWKTAEYSRYPNIFRGWEDTDVDSHKSLPVLPFTRERLDSVELYPFRKAVQAGVGRHYGGAFGSACFEAQRGLPSSLSRNVVYDLRHANCSSGDLSSQMLWL